MFEPLGELPEGLSGLRASGTIVERDVTEAVASAAKAMQGSKGRGLVVIVGPDFDGYLAELVRGLAKEAAVAPFARYALVVKDDELDEVRQYGCFGADNLRVFGERARQSAIEWAAG